MKSYLSEDSEHIKIVKFEEVLTNCDGEISQEIILKEDFSHFEEVTTEINNDCDNTENNEISVDYEINLSFTCDDCNTICKDAEYLELHKVECQKKTLVKYSCPTCFRRFKYEEALKSHYVTCSMVECEFCDKKFRTQGFLKVKFLN